MAQVIMYTQGIKVQQRGVDAPKRASVKAWVTKIRKAFKKELLELGAIDLKVHNSIVNPDDIRLGCQNGIAFWILRNRDAMAGN